MSLHVDLDDSSIWSLCLGSVTFPAAFDAQQPQQTITSSYSSSPSHDAPYGISPASLSCDSFTDSNINTTNNTPDNTPVLTDSHSPLLHDSSPESFDTIIWPDLPGPHHASSSPSFDIDNTCLLPNEWLAQSLLTVDPDLSDFRDPHTMTAESIRFTPISTTTWPASSSVSAPLTPPTPKSAEPAEQQAPYQHRAPLPPANNSKRKRVQAEEDEAAATQVEKRRRNNIAAAKCRQKKLDRITELENTLAEIQKERDDLKLQLAKREEEIRVYRDIVLERKNS